MSNFLINKDFKKPLPVILMESKEKLTIFTIGSILIMLILVFFLPFSPLNINNIGSKIAYAMILEQNKQELQELVDSYNNNGVSLSEDDYKLVVEKKENGEEEVSIIVTNEDKRNQMVQNTQQKINVIVSNYVGYHPNFESPNPSVDNSTDNPPNPAPPSPNAPVIDEPVEEPELPSLEDIISTVNNLNLRLNQWVKDSIAADEELGIDTGYINKLIDQRLTGEPDGDTLLFDVYSYDYMGDCLNAQAFVALNTKRAELTPEDYLYDFTRLSTNSPDLYSNLLKYRIYEEQFSLDNFNKVGVEEYEQTYTLILSNGIKEEYKSVIKVTFDDYEIILTLKNNELLVLDITKIVKE